MGPIGAMGDAGRLDHMQEQPGDRSDRIAWTPRQVSAFVQAEGRQWNSHIVGWRAQDQVQGMIDSTGLMALAAVTFLLAGFVKGVIGLGLPTVAVGLLGLAMAPAQAAAVLIVPSFVTNIWQIMAGPPLVPLLRRLWLLLIGICVGTWAGAGILNGSGAGYATEALGIALIIYAGIGLVATHRRVPARLEPVLSPLIGAVTGAVTAATGVFVIPAVPYLQALGLERDALVKALGLSFTVSTVALAVSLAADGAFNPAVATTSLLALAPALAGMAVDNGCVPGCDWKRSGAASSWACWRSAPISPCVASYRCVTRSGARPNCSWQSDSPSCSLISAVLCGPPICDALAVLPQRPAEARAARRLRPALYD